ncbi:MAG: dihydrofolate reductase [Bacteroidetes bacterium]|nr:MAG: dihydrofolate reductase [Bacteroidota bacterium]
MRKLILAINTTLDGFCDHRAVIADGELHEFFNELLKKADTMLYGRKTFELMEAYWPMIARTKEGTKEEVEFAELLDPMEKIVFSKSGYKTDWKNTTVLQEMNPSVIKALKQKTGKNLLVGSPSILDQLIPMDLIDEFIYVVHPILAGAGKRFFEIEKLSQKVQLSFQDCQPFLSGAQALHYVRSK